MSIFAESLLYRAFLNWNAFEFSPLFVLAFSLPLVAKLFSRGLVEEAPCE